MPAASLGSADRVDRAWLGAQLGARAGALSAALDIASTILWLSDAADQFRLILALLAIGTAAGAIVGGAIGFAIGERLARPASLRSRATSIAWFVAPAFAPVAWLLFSGGAMRRLPGVWALRGIAWPVLTLVASFALALIVETVRSLRARPRWARTLAVCGFIATGMILHAVDHRFLPRLYEYLHTGLAAWMAVAFAAALAIGFPTPRTLPRRTASVAFVAAFVGLIVAWRGLERWDNVRAEVFGVHAPFVRHVALGVAAVVAPREADSVRNRDARRARFVRERAGVTVAENSLPRSPGAHVVLITIDALRADRIGRVRNGTSLTPALDALAARGVRFDHAYAQAPHSSYSITSLHTSEYLHETVPLGQRQPIATLADAFGQRGYHTVGIYTNGIFFTEGERLTVYRERNFGFRRSDHVDRRADAQTDLAMQTIDDVVRRGEPPAFFWVHYFDAHEPYAGAGDSSMDRYDAAIRSVDRAIGRLLAHAGQHFARDMIIAVTADHGEEFGEHGGVYHGSALYEEQVRVPLILVAPGLTAGRVATPVELIDVAPTLLATSGIDRPNSMRGRDLRPLALAGASQAIAPSVFAAVNTRSMVVRWPFKLIADLRYGVTELYDLERDPSETRNLAGSDRARTTELRAELATWIDQLGQSAIANVALARGRLGDRRALDELTALARNPALGPRARTEAIDVIAKFYDRAAVAPLAALLADPVRDVADRAAMAMGASGDPRALPRLRDAVTRDDPSTRGQAALALARIGDASAVPALIELLASTDEPARLAAIDALGSLRTLDAVDSLLDAYRDDHVRYRLVLALGQIADPRTLPLLLDAAAHDRSDEVRANATAALALAGNRRAVPLIARLALSDPNQRYAASALGRIGATGHEIAGWDARAADASEWLACASVTDEPVWRYLSARACTANGRAHVPVRIRDATRALTMIIRARGTGPLTVFAAGREIASVPIAQPWREWQIRLSAGALSEARGELEIRAPAHFETAHIVLLETEPL